ncbi:uncharacterized protein LOC124543747 isoform X2 [Vanessa cardui]|uniref:uncharacterized protein LOC124543747 isoform X2 n=1 Tax=Vanessa cardui TaxID=171605 RepID=UPI001F13DD98|nr:uncharacterized protein LOC124543747 isoform X2 [Vanessa cardui]
MQTLWFLVILVLSNEALGMSYRQKRQNEESEEDLEDRYGWNRPNFPRFPQRPWRPNPNPFPQQRPIPDQGQGQFTTTTTTAASPTTNANTVNDANIQACIRSCPVTTEYNPVCGTNSVTYDNPGRLNCARACGVNVSLLRSSRCPPATPAP